MKTDSFRLRRRKLAGAGFRRGAAADFSRGVFNPRKAAAQQPASRQRRLTESNPAIQPSLSRRDDHGKRPWVENPRLNSIATNVAGTRLERAFLVLYARSHFLRHSFSFGGG